MTFVFSLSKLCMPRNLQMWNVLIHIYIDWLKYFTYFSQQNLTILIKNGFNVKIILSNKLVQWKISTTCFVLYFSYGNCLANMHKLYETILTKWQRTSDLFSVLCFLAFVLLCFSSSCVLCTQYCQCLWIVHSWFLLISTWDTM
jgi:hypothetical protein